MIDVDVADDRLTVTLRGADRFWALRRRIEVPLDHVRGATADPGMSREPAGVRWPGTHVPGVITSGTYRKDGERTFWHLRPSQEPVVVELADERFARLVLGVDDARATADRLDRAVRRRAV